MRVKEKGIDLFSITDHDAIKGAGIMRNLLREDDPGFISGVEFSCKDEEGKYHILGYGYDPDAEGIRSVVALGHSYRMRKVHARLEFLTKEFGFRFPKEEIEALYELDNPGKPHIANLLVKLGYVPNKDDAIRDYINKIHFKSDYVRPEEAISGILASGGIPILAHPSYGSGDQLILGEEMRKRIEKLRAFGIQGLEAFYSGFTAKLTGELLRFAEEYELYVTAGSDYHGTNKLVMLGDSGIEDACEGPIGLQRFVHDVRRIRIGGDKK